MYQFWGSIDVQRHWRYFSFRQTRVWRHYNYIRRPRRVKHLYSTFRIYTISYSLRDNNTFLPQKSIVPSKTSGTFVSYYCCLRALFIIVIGVHHAAVSQSFWFAGADDLFSVTRNKRFSLVVALHSLAVKQNTTISFRVLWPRNRTNKHYRCVRTPIAEHDRFDLRR